MQTTAHHHPEGQFFTLTAESEQDHAFIEALDLQRHVEVRGFERAPVPGIRCHTKVGVQLLVGQTKNLLRAKAGSEFARAFSELLRLSAADAAGHGHVSTHAADPQTQEALATSLEKLQLVAQTLSEVVGKQGAVLQKMVSAHGETSVSIFVDTAGI